MDYITIFFASAFGYLVGSVNGAQVIHHLLGRYRAIHPSQIGTKNAGMQNVWMMIGKVPALVVLAIDLPKGYLAVFLGERLLGLEGGLLLLPGLFAIVGHNWPLFFHFRGGRGVATLAGVMLAYDIRIALVAFLIATPFVLVRFSGLTPFVILLVALFLDASLYGIPLVIMIALIMLAIILRRLQAEWKVLETNPRKLWVLKNIIVFDRSSANPPPLAELIHTSYK